MKNTISLILITLFLTATSAFADKLVSISLDGDSTSVTTKTAGYNINFTSATTGLPAHISDTVSVRIIPNYFGEIISADDFQSFTLNTFVTTGTAQLAVYLRDSILIADTIEITFTGEDQEIFYVNTSGDSINWGSGADDALLDPVQAIRYASPGDKVMIAEGEYFVAKNASLQADISIEGAGMGKTIIKNHDDYAAAEASYMTNDADSGLSNINGEIAYRFIYCNDTSVNFSIKDITFKYWTYYGAGGVFNTKCQARLENIEVAESFANLGVAIQGGIDSRTELINCNFHDNKALYFGDIDGGTKNGGAVCFSAFRSILVDGCIISNTFCEMDDSNDAQARDRISDGGGMHINYTANTDLMATVTVRNSTFMYNSVQNENGRLGVGGCGAGLNVNIADLGADAYADMVCYALVENCTFAYNDGITAGGMRFNSSAKNSAGHLSFDVINNTFAYNTSTRGDAIGAGGLYINNNTYTINVINNICAYNTTDGVASDLSANNNFRTKGAVYTMSNNIAEKVYNKNIEQFEDVNNNISGVQSILLADTLTDNGGTVPTFALVTGSPAINAGSDSVIIPTVDARGYDRDATPDIGAYEFDADAPAGLTNSKVNTMDFVLYPNPCSQTLMIKNIQKGSVEIISLSGQLMMTKQIDSALSSIDVSALKQGLYIVTAISQDSKSSKMLQIK